MSALVELVTLMRKPPVSGTVKKIHRVIGNSCAVYPSVSICPPCTCALLVNWPCITMNEEPSRFSGQERTVSLGAQQQALDALRQQFPACVPLPAGHGRPASSTSPGSPLTDCWVAARSSPALRRTEWKASLHDVVLAQADAHFRRETPPCPTDGQRS